MPDVQRWMPIAMRFHSLRRLMLVLLTSLMLVQTIGVLHRVAHAQQSTGAAKHVAIDTSGLLAVIWGEHSTSAECQLFDHACPDLMHVAVWAVPRTLPEATWVSAVLLERFALFERFYAARGPPVVVI